MNSVDASRLRRDLQREMGASFTCSEHGDHLRISTPYRYPDGDRIDLFCKVEDGVTTVSDLAETTGWLHMQSAGLRRSPKQARLIEDACVTHGIEFHRGMLRARCRPGDDLAQVVTRVAQAALRISDLCRRPEHGGMTTPAVGPTLRRSANRTTAGRRDRT